MTNAPWLAFETYLVLTECIALSLAMLAIVLVGLDPLAKHNAAMRVAFFLLRLFVNAANTVTFHQILKPLALAGVLWKVWGEHHRELACGKTLILHCGKNERRVARIVGEGSKSKRCTDARPRSFAVLTLLSTASIPFTS